MNLGNLDPALVAAVRVRRFDGADTWTYLNLPGRLMFMLANDPRWGNRMKSLVAALVLGAALATSGFAADVPARASLMGAWAVDTARLPLPPEARPRSVTITFAEVGSGQLRTRVEVVDPTGARLEADGTTPLDGSPTPVASNFEADISATTMPRPEVLIMQLGKNGVPASTRIYAVGADGQSMIETVAYFDANGRPVLRRNYFTRLR